MRRMLQVRKQHGDVFGTGSFEVLGAENPSALAYVREMGDDVILCVNNLSRFAQPVELQLGRFAGWQPVELLGRVPFPRIGELPYFITLGSHDFYWFQLVQEPPS
jgi:maltose alpha-D-glucosyltransferase/alpha-amylase